MPDYAKVKDHRGLVRDLKSKAVLTIDQQALQEHRRKRQMMSDLISQGDKVRKLENDMAEIKDMLKQLLSK